MDQLHVIPTTGDGRSIINGVKVGDKVETSGGANVPAGTFEVVRVDQDDTNQPLKVKVGGRERWLVATQFVRVVERDGKPFDAPASVTGPIWMLVKVGDTIRVQGDADVDDGNHVVKSIDDDLNFIREGVSIRLETRDVKIYNHTVKAILKRDGEDFVVTQAMVDALTAARPIWEHVLAGDVVEVTGHSSSTDGRRTVQLADDDQFRGANREGIRIEGHGYIPNRRVTAILERDGKPYTGPTGENYQMPLSEQVQVGDTISISAGEEIEAGNYKVEHTDADTSGSAASKGIRVKTSAYDTKWVRNDQVLAILERDGQPYVEGAEPVWKQVRQGDRVRIEDEGELADGVYLVQEVDAHSLDDRDSTGLLLEHDEDEATWIYNHAVREIVERDGKPYGQPRWQDLKPGDIVEISATPSNELRGFHVVREAGEYRVRRLDTASSPSADLRILLESKTGVERGWIPPSKLVRLVSQSEARDETAWQKAKVGDTIKIVGSTLSSQPDGDYEVDRVDAGNGNDRRLRVKNPGGTVWVNNRHVHSIVTGSTPPAANLPPHKQAKVRDTVRVEGSPYVADGEYTVSAIDTNPSDASLLEVRVGGGSRWWIRNEHIKAVVRKGGAPAVEPAQEAKAGDTVRIEGSDIADGEYEVARISSIRNDSSRVMVRSQDRGRWWVRNNTVKAIVRRAGEPNTLPATTTVSVPVDTRKPHELAEVGDTIRVEGQSDTEDGEYEVSSIGTSRPSHRVRIKYRGALVWNIRNEFVKAIVRKKGAPDTTPRSYGIRGDFLVHVDVATILANRAAGEHKPVTVVRRLAEMGTPHVARELAWDGATRFVHHEFMKLEGTDIQNWIETDQPITCWRDDEPLEVMFAKQQAQGTTPPMLKPILGAFVIHVAAPVLIRNRREGRNDPVIAVRAAHSDWANDVTFCRKVEWSGPTRMVHRPTTPVPGTEGRGVAFVETDATLTLTVDGQPPIVLAAPQPRLLLAA